MAATRLEEIERCSANRPTASASVRSTSTRKARSFERTCGSLAERALGSTIEAV
jgi:hypothetical protein